MKDPLQIHVMTFVLNVTFTIYSQVDPASNNINKNFIIL